MITWTSGMSWGEMLLIINDPERPDTIDTKVFSKVDLRAVHLDWVDLIRSIFNGNLVEYIFISLHWFPFVEKNITDSDYTHGGQTAKSGVIRQDNLSMKAGTVTFLNCITVKL